MRAASYWTACRVGHASLLPAPTPGVARGAMSANGLEPLIAERVALGPLRSSLSLFIRRHIWVITGLGLVVVSIILLLWARTRPGYDPYGWLVWGYQTLHLTLNVGGAPSWKPLPYGGIALIAIMWFGIPWITNGQPAIAGQLAMGSPRRLDHNQVTGTIGRFTGLHDLPVWIAALGAAALAVRRRNRLVLALAGGVVLWVMVEIAFAFHGFPALPCYMFEAGGVVAVLAGIGVGWALTDLPHLRRGLPWWSGIPIVVVLIASLGPGALARVRTEHVDLRHERGRTDQIALPQTTIDSLGGYRHIDDCGEPVTIVEYASALAWLTHLDDGSVGYVPKREKRRKRPIVLLLPAGGRVASPLRDGLGSIVTYADGQTAIGAWNAEVPRRGLAIQSVRQNLPLLIDHGHLAATIDCQSCWGATVGGAADVARSALGITADGHLMWAAGEGLSVAALGDALLSANVVRAVELDINPDWVAGYLYPHTLSGQPTNIIPVVPNQTGVAGFFLAPYGRDFFSILAR
jgi:hypothetical protein